MTRTRVVATSVVLVSLALGSTAWAVAGGAQESESPDSVSVPVGHINDTGQYATYARTDPSQPWEPMSTWAFRVDGVRQALDQTGMERKAVDVSWAGRTGTLPPADVGYDTWQFAYTEGVTLDASTRHAIQTQTFGQASGSLAPVAIETNAQNVARTYYGPNYADAWPWPFWSIAQLPMLFSVQGMTFAAGSELAPDDIHLADGEWTLRAHGGLGPGIQTVVAGFAESNGEVWSDLRTSGCTSLSGALDPVAGGPWLPSRHGRPSPEQAAVGLFHTYVPPVSEVCFEIDVWVSGSSPYPVRYEERVVVNGTESYEWLETLVAVEQGTGDIPWQGGDASKAYREYDPDVERSGRPHPADGSKYPFSYSLDEALDSVYEDDSLTGFQAWRRDHSDVYLLGGTLREGARTCSWQNVVRDDMAVAWDLLFGRPEGEYAMVRSIPAAAPGLPGQNCAYGPERPPTVITFEAELLAEDAVTVSQMAARLSSLMGESDPPFDSMQWGWYPGLGCTRAEIPAAPRLPVLLCEPAGPGQGGWGAFLGLRQGAIGFIQPTGDGVTSGGVDQMYVILDVGTGNIIYGYQSEHDTSPRIIPLAPAAAAPDAGPMVEGGVPSDAGAPIAALAIGGSALLIGLAAVFAPLVKYHASPLLFLIPGYAKLKRHQLLDLELRDRIHKAVVEEPGVHLRELARRVEATTSTIAYHLRVLKRNGFVMSFVDGRYRRFFAAGSTDWNDRDRVAALKNDRTRAVHRIIRQDPGANQADLAAAVGITTAGIGWHLKRLESAGLVDRDRNGRTYHYYPIRSDEEAMRVDVRNEAS